HCAVYTRYLSLTSTLHPSSLFPYTTLFRSRLITLHLKSHGKMLWEFANGIGTDVVQAEPEQAKGIGNSTTLSEDAATYEEACPVFRELADSVGRRLKKAGQIGRASCRERG